MSDTTSVSKCDIVRAAALASTCGMCSQPAGGGGPAVCGAEPPPGAVCSIPSTANTRMKLQALRLSPKNLIENTSARFVRAQTEAVYEADIAATEAAIAAAYPGASGAVSWVDFERCLVTPTGEAGGENNDIRFARIDLEGIGFAPDHPIGGGALAGKVWRDAAKPSPLPVTVDYFMNPDLFVVVVVCVIVCILAGVVYRRHRRKTGARRAAERAQACAAAVAALRARGDGRAADAVAAKCAPSPVATEKDSSSR